ncbi:MAG: hypothetical protein MK030_05945, partial [SAR116 cluster bacterium]|nr:hypothetical protein [SAR116 cluster bacterium]
MTNFVVNANLYSNGLEARGASKVKRPESRDFMRPSLKPLTICLTVITTFLATSVPAGAVRLEETLRAALSNSLTLQSARKSWLASREDIGTAFSTSEWRATGTLTGNQYKTDAKGSTKSGFLDSQSV